MQTHDNLRAAIGLMTAWNDDMASHQVQVQYLAAIDDPGELMGMAKGASLVGILLTKRHTEVGVSETHTLLELPCSTPTARHAAKPSSASGTGR
jgi:hypothetical protein